jgi:hypothetical protein
MTLAHQTGHVLVLNVERVAIGNWSVTCDRSKNIYKAQLFLHFNNHPSCLQTTIMLPATIARFLLYVVGSALIGFYTPLAVDLILHQIMAVSSKWFFRVGTDAAFDQCHRSEIIQHIPSSLPLPS